MSSNKKDKKNRNYKEKSTDSKNHSKDGLTINISITYNFGNKEIHVEQRAEGGGQINKHVGTNANQGGQNAIDHSKSENDHSQFADGNGRSGIAGSDNDEAGGQQGIKVRDSKVKESIIKSVSEQGGGAEQNDGETFEEPGDGTNV